MSALIWVGFAAFFFVALAVGIRLLAMASRTRELPELLMGIGVLGIGPVGFGLMVAAQQVRGSSPELQPWLSAIAMFAVSSGALAKYVFNWRVYHAESKTVRAVVVGAGSLMLASFAYAGLVDGFARADELGARGLMESALRIGCLLWGSAEALAYWNKMRRRVRLGLADAVVANRFLMWAVGAGAAGIGSAVGTAAQLVLGAHATGANWVMASSSLHGLVAAIAIGLAFIPPPAYLRYIRSRAERMQGPVGD